MKCIIIEDDISFAIDTKILATKIGLKVVSVFNQPEGVKSTLISKKIDVILSDIDLGKGKHAYDLFKGIPNLPPIIFFTGMTKIDIYENASELNPYIYLQKPFSESTLRSAVDGIRRQSHSIEIKPKTSINSKTTFIRSAGKLFPIPHNSILFIKSEGNYLYVQTRKNKISVRSSISNFLKDLQDTSFIQIHRAFIVNVMYVQEITIGQNLVKLNNFELPIGRRYKKLLLEKLEDITYQ